mgnify:CR=1 FL=1
MRSLLFFACLCFSLTANAGVLPWDVKGKVSLGLEKEDAPYRSEDYQKKYDLELDFSKAFNLARGYPSAVSLSYEYENWFEVQDKDEMEHQGHTYRLQWDVHF